MAKSATRRRRRLEPVYSTFGISIDCLRVVMAHRLEFGPESASAFGPPSALRSVAAAPEVMGAAARVLHRRAIVRSWSG
jgi:hypothetical protein